MATPPPASRTPPSTKRPAPPPPAAGVGPKAPARVAKTFSIAPWSSEGEGQKIVVYGESGLGKSSLAMLAPDPVFIGIDDGARNLRHPVSGEPVKAVLGIESFRDFLDAIRQPGLLTKGQTLVIDTGTMLEELSEAYIFETITTDGGKTVSSLEGYGYGKGYRHALETMTMVLQELEARFIRKGIHVLILAQESAATMANAEGLDFLVAGPKFHHNKQCSTRLKVQEWADHVLRISFESSAVIATGPKATKGKLAANASTTRVINAATSRHYFAKSRTLTEPVISFADPSDDSLWQFMFPAE